MPTIGALADDILVPRVDIDAAVSELIATDGRDAVIAGEQDGDTLLATAAADTIRDRLATVRVDRCEEAMQVIKRRAPRARRLPHLTALHDEDMHEIVVDDQRRRVLWAYLDDDEWVIEVLTPAEAVTQAERVVGLAMDVLADPQAHAAPEDQALVGPVEQAERYIELLEGEMYHLEILAREERFARGRALVGLEPPDEVSMATAVQQALKGEIRQLEARIAYLRDVRATHLLELGAGEHVQQARVAKMAGLSPMEVSRMLERARRRRQAWLDSARWAAQG